MQGFYSISFISMSEYIYVHRKAISKNEGILLGQGSLSFLDEQMFIPTDKNKTVHMTNNSTMLSFSSQCSYHKLSW
jgi:hypothetical protein